MMKTVIFLIIFTLFSSSLLAQKQMNTIDTKMIDSLIDLHDKETPNQKMSLQEKKVLKLNLLKRFEQRNRFLRDSSIVTELIELHDKETPNTKMSSKEKENLKRKIVNSANEEYLRNSKISGNVITGPDGKRYKLQNEKPHEIIDSLRYISKETKEKKNLKKDSAIIKH